jgi:serine/threonine protein kinase/Tol biopolymer transport system component
MTPERWQAIERLYHAALERADDQRAAFLAAACPDDEELCREVESLLACQPRAKDFIEAPAAKGHVSPIASVFRRHELSVPGRFAGRRFGSYQLETLIAAGGMGEVYRAVDTRLNRTVAIKTLPEHLSDDAARRERFKREAQIVSSLNHPHICTLHDMGVQDGIDYLVLEHIDGETLQERLERGPLPLTLALEYAVQIVDALDKAHRRGITHRDLKPANVMLTASGVKVLDFGLATWSPLRATAGEPPGRHSPDGLTAEGTIMGTPQYGSPEQLEGKPADARTDIFSFGTIAYEMITGQRAFQGASPARLVSAILRDDPRPIGELVPGVPPLAARTLSRCLAKDPDDRWQTANDLLFGLRAIASPAAAVNVTDSRPGGGRLWIERAAWSAALLASVVATVLWVRPSRVAVSNPAPATPDVRFTLFPAQDTDFYAGYDLPFALSPDGRQIVYVAARADGTKQLWLRSLSSDLQRPIPGTDDANFPFWSPDSQWVGFFAGNSLKKFRVSSGLAQIIVDKVTTLGGAAWSADDVILFAPGRGGLSRVSAKGGPISTVTKGEGGHLWPQFLGDGKHFIYAAPVPGAVFIGSLQNEAPRTLMEFPVRGRISSLGHVPGYVLFVRDATLFARPFDEARLEFSGDPVRIVDGIPVTGPGRAPFSVSASGVLAYWPYGVGTPATLRWFERDGRASAAVETPAQYIGFTLSPDSRQLVFSRIARNGGADLWLRDLTQGSEHQMTFDGAAFTPQWSPTLARIVFTGPGDGPPPKLFIRNVAGGAAATRIGNSPGADFASSWSGDGRAIVSVRNDPITLHDLWLQHLEGGDGARLSIDTSFNETHGKVSPDNRWIAYVTDESGKEEVWIASFPSGESRRQVSVGGGTSPEWGDGSKEIWFISDDKQVMAVSFKAGQPGVDVSTPRALFRIGNLVEVDRLAFPTSNVYVVAGNGQRVLAAVRARDPNAPPISIIVNWPALLHR